MDTIHPQPGDELPDSSPGLQLADQLGPSQVSQVIFAAEANVAHNGNTHTWTQDTRADWETGVMKKLDNTSVSGTLQLAQRYFGENTTLTPRNELASEQDPSC